MLCGWCQVLDSFYKVESKFKWKLFDCLTGKIICDYLQDHNAMVGAGSGPSSSSAMFTESIHGVTVVGPRDTLDNYVAELKLEKEVCIYFMYVCMYHILCIHLWISNIYTCITFLSYPVYVRAHVSKLCVSLRKKVKWLSRMWWSHTSPRIGTRKRIKIAAYSINHHRGSLKIACLRKGNITIAVYTEMLLSFFSFAWYIFW